MTISRRKFIGLAAGAAAATAAAASIPALQYLDRVGHGGRLSPKVASLIHSSCGLCPNKCGIVGRVEDGVLKKIDPNPHFPKSRGMVCARGNAGVKVLYDPDRLKTPLIRNGARGEGKWLRATWDEALDHVAEKMLKIKEQYGPEGMLFSSTEGFQEEFFHTLAGAYGSPNLVRHPTLCLASVNNGCFNTFGTVPECDIANARYVVISGANRLESFITPDTMDMVESLAKKTKLVYLDPRYTVTAAKADFWLPIRPGTDMAFALAMINVIIAEDLHDHEFVADYTHGFDELAAHVRPYTPQWAEQETGIPAGDIYRVAREFAAAAPRCLYYGGRRTSWFDNDTQFRRCIGIVNAIVGNWDRPGGVVPKRKIPLGELLIFPYDDPVAERVDGLEQNYPLAARRDGVYGPLREAVLAGDPYPVKGWMVYKQDPMNGLPDTAKTRRMIDQMDLMVSIDVQLSDTAWLSDVVLPESTYLERLDPLHSLKGLWPVVAARQPVVEPLFDTKPNLEIMQELAARLDVGEYLDFTMEEFIEAQAEELPVSLEEVMEKGCYAPPDPGPIYGKTRNPGHRFGTRTGKIELASERYRERGYDALPTYRPPVPVPEGKFRLLTGRTAVFTHAMLQNNVWLHELQPENVLWLNAARAERLGVRSGDDLEVSSSVGRVRLKAWVTEGIHPECVFMLHGFGKRSRGLTAVFGRGANDQDLLETHTEEITGNMAFHQTFVEVRRV